MSSGSMSVGKVLQAAQVAQADQAAQVAPVSQVAEEIGEYLDIVKLPPKPLHYPSVDPYLGYGITNSLPIGSSDLPTGSSDLSTGSSDLSTGSSDLPTGSSDLPTGSSDLPSSNSSSTDSIELLSIGSGSNLTEITQVSTETRILKYS